MYGLKKRNYLAGLGSLFLLNLSILLLSSCSFVTFGGIDRLMKKDVLSFKLNSSANADLSADVNGFIGSDTIDLRVPQGTVVTALSPEISFLGDKIEPPSGTVQNFTNPIDYKVTARDGSVKNYRASVSFFINNTINRFSFPAGNNVGKLGTAIDCHGTISGTNITVDVPAGTDVTALVPTIDAAGATLSPASGTAQNFTTPISYTVTPTSGAAQTYTVTVVVAPSSDKDITGFTLTAASNPALVTDVTSDIQPNTVSLTLPSGTDLTALVPTITLSGGSIDPASGTAIDLTGPVTYTVTAADASVKVYTVTASGSGAPTISDRNLLLTSVTENTVALSWTAAEDTAPGDSTPQASLRYRLVYSETPIATISEANLATISLDFSAGTLNHTVGGLRSDTLYYFNVIVEDLQGNQVIYNQTSATTVSSVVTGMSTLYALSGSGTDGSVNGHDLLVTGSVSYVNNRAGNPNSACRITGGNSLYIADANALNFTNEMTISMWLNLTDVGTQQVLIGKLNAGRTMGYQLGINAEYLYFEVRDSVQNPYFCNDDTTKIAANSWVHIGFSWRSGGKMRIYVNGLMIKETAASTGPIGGGTTEGFRIGADSGSPPLFPIVDAVFDDLRVYSRELSSGEINELAGLAAD